MKSAKERQRDYRERRKEQKKAGLIKLKILTSVSAGKKLEMLSEIDHADMGKVLDQAVELLWTRRFGNVGIAGEQATEAEKAIEPEKEKKKKSEKGKKKEAKPGNAKAKPRAKASKNKPETEIVLVATI
ncbi:MAG: hypothetical protein KDJ54_14015 [Candidatus Competibacteraceae bacterium]|nr:hypothetical protein [Candidatus Competibacteraceae bacterium]